MRNKERKITGCLIHFKSSFFQIIEGEKTTIENLYIKLKKDKRHYNVVLIRKGFKGKRTFDDWSLAYVDKSLIQHTGSGTMRFDVRLELLLSKHKNSATNTSRFWEGIRDFVLASAEVE